MYYTIKNHKGIQMSLLKILKKDIVSKDVDTMRKDFLEIVETIVEEPMYEDVLALVAIYTDVAIQYIDRVARTLEQQQGIKDTMNFMNTYITEVVTGAGYHYFHKEKGYSIVDKCIQDALDNDGVLYNTTIEKNIQEIEHSYVEPDDIDEGNL